MLLKNSPSAGVFRFCSKTQIQEVEEKLQQFHDSGFKVVAVSMDDKERAEKFASEVASNMGKNSLDTPILYGLSEDQALNQWGLYISEKRPGSREPEIYSEPGFFVVRPDNTVFMIQTQSAPFTRPPAQQMIETLSFAFEHDYPTRGTYKKNQNKIKSTPASKAAMEDPINPYKQMTSETQ